MATKKKSTKKKVVRTEIKLYTPHVEVCKMPITKSEFTQCTEDGLTPDEWDEVEEDVRFNHTDFSYPVCDDTFLPSLEVSSDDGTTYEKIDIVQMYHDELRKVKKKRKQAKKTKKEISYYLIENNFFKWGEYSLEFNGKFDPTKLKLEIINSNDDIYADVIGYSISYDGDELDMVTLNSVNYTDFNLVDSNGKYYEMVSKDEDDCDE